MDETCRFWAVLKESGTQDEVSKWRVRYQLYSEDPESEWIELELRHFTRELPLSNLPPGVSSLTFEILQKWRKPYCKNI